MDTWEAILVSAFVAACTTVAMQSYSTLRAKRTAMFEAIRYLSDAADDIEFVLNDLSHIDFANWDSHARRRAANVCSRMHIVGSLAEKRVIDDYLMAKLWYFSIPRTRIILDPFIESKRNACDPNYWSRYDWLDQRCRKVNAKVQGFAIPSESGGS